MKVWITKYALTKGIFEVEGERSETCVSMICVGKSSLLEFYHQADWHISEQEALERAEVMRCKKITSLKKQIARLEKQVFEKK